jgi:hypothetical protein
MTSPDGITWTDRFPPERDWRGVTYSPSLALLVAVATSGTGDRVMTSRDGITWKLGNTPSDLFWKRIIWSQFLGLFVAISSTDVMISPDGFQWTLINTPDNTWSDIVWSFGLNKLFAVGASGTGNRVMVS